jgi:hypothetical protein
LIVAYADKRAGQRLESMAERFASWERRYPPAETSRRARGSWTAETLAEVQARAEEIERRALRGWPAWPGTCAAWPGRAPRPSRRAPPRRAPPPRAPRAAAAADAGSGAADAPDGAARLLLGRRSYGVNHAPDGSPLGWRATDRRWIGSA